MYDEMGGVDFGGSQSHSMYLRFGGGYVGPGTKVEAYDSQRDSGSILRSHSDIQLSITVLSLLRTRVAA
jgi:hypothetical protein